MFRQVFLATSTCLLLQACVWKDDAIRSGKAPLAEKVPLLRTAPVVVHEEKGSRVAYYRLENGSLRTETQVLIDELKNLGFIWSLDRTTEDGINVLKPKNVALKDQPYMIAVYPGQVGVPKDQQWNSKASGVTICFLYNVR